MGTRHLYLTLTGPSFTVWAARTASQTVSKNVESGGCQADKKKRSDRQPTRTVVRRPTRTVVRRSTRTVVRRPTRTAAGQKAKRHTG